MFTGVIGVAGGEGCANIVTTGAGMVTGVEITAAGAIEAWFEVTMTGLRVVWGAATGVKVLGGIEAETADDKDVKEATDLVTADVELAVLAGSTVTEGIVVIESLFKEEGAAETELLADVEGAPETIALSFTGFAATAFCLSPCINSAATCAAISCGDRTGGET